MCFIFSFKKIEFWHLDCLSIDCVGRSHDLVVLWKEEINFEEIQHSNHHIHGAITPNSDGTRWFLTRVYRHPKTSKRHEVWALIKALKCKDLIP